MNDIIQPIRQDSPELLRQTGLIHRFWSADSYPSPPTLLLLHGRAGNEDVPWVFARSAPQGTRLIAPRAPFADALGGFSWTKREEDAIPTLPQFAEGVDHLHQFIEALPQLYGVDLSRLWLLGFSQGAALAFAYQLRYPQFVRGISALVGFVAQDGDDYTALRDCPIYMAVGRQDETIPLALSRQSGQRLIQAGAKLDYREYETGHKLNGQGMKDLAFWLKTALLGSN